MRRLERLFIGAFTALTVTSALFGCGGDSSTDSVAGDVSVKVLSTRPDMVTDGDAYVEVALPTGANVADLKVDVDGADVTAQFARRDNGRILGVVSGLKVGASTITATLKSANRGAHLVVTNYDRGGPIFSGPQVQPWICATKSGSPATVVAPNTLLSATVTSKVSGLDADPADGTCNAAPKFTYYYQPASKANSSCTMTVAGTNPCFVAYDPSARPADDQISDFKNDRGDTVKSLLRMELGTADRGEYQILTYFDPAKPWTPWAPQKGWNGKVMWKFGAAASGNRFQRSPADSTFSQSIWDENALAAGFMVVTDQLTNHFDNPNELLATESMMIVKEHIIDTYGEVRYTMADGQSGGAIMQTVISSVMPGLLQGAQTTGSYPEGVSFFIEVKDCGILSKYYQTAAGSALTLDQRTAIEGKDPAYCKTWVDSFTSAQIPTLSSNCGTGFPDAITYDPATRPLGVRCSPFDMLVNLLGTAADADGNVKPKLPYDNTGVQYGLAALKAGSITPEQFVQLNEQIGAFDVDMNWTGGSTTAPTVPATRFRSVPDAFPQLYKSGVMANSRNLAKIAIIDLRPERGPDIHQAWRSAAMRARLDAVNGGHANQVIRGSSQYIGTAMTAQSFHMMDRWLAAIEADTSSAAIEQKVINNKPADVHDGCYANSGETAADLTNELSLTDAGCPISATLAQQRSPRINSGGPLAEDVFKCQLKAFDATSADYASVTFSASQIARLKAVFTDGVCDWSKSGVGYTTDWSPTTFMSGPAGAIIPAPPAAVAF